MWINDASYSFPQQTGSENGVGGIGIIDLVSAFTNQVCQSGGGTYISCIRFYIKKKFKHAPFFSSHFNSYYPTTLKPNDVYRFLPS